MAVVVYLEWISSAEKIKDYPGSGKASIGVIKEVCGIHLFLRTEDLIVLKHAAQLPVAISLIYSMEAS